MEENEREVSIGKKELGSRGKGNMKRKIEEVK
jgi:hypothetical protein